MSLFSEIEREYLGPALFAEARYRFLDRSARPEAETARRRLDRWFSRLPKQETADIRGRLRSKNDTDHYSAVFELFLHELLLCLGCSVTLHPDINETTHPEFLVKPPVADAFYLEARLAQTESVQQRAARARMNDVYDVLNRLKSPNFWLALNLKGSPEISVSTKKMRNSLKKKLANLDPDILLTQYEEHGIRLMPEWSFDRHRWLTFTPIPKPLAARGNPDSRPLEIWYPETELCRAREAIREALENKASKYGDLKSPYVIAVNALPHGVDSEDEMDALFGDSQWTVKFGDSQSEGVPSRATNGFWWGKKGPQRQGVSAILLFRRLQVHNYADVNVRLYHNPCAKRPYSSDLTRLPQAIPEEIRMRQRDGETVGAIMAGTTV